MMSRGGLLAACVVVALLHATKAVRPPVDPDTPTSAHKTTSGDQTNHPGEFEIVFSDEFSQDGRSFAEGADPYWTAPNVWNQATADHEYYDSSHVTTDKGNMVITATQDSTIPQCPYTSGMLHTWNKMCFQGGIFEFRVRLPGDGVHRGFWHAVWLLGNLGKVGHPNSLNNMWPWSYDICDPNKQWQRISSCNSTPGDGLNPTQGRGAPEIDVLESRRGGAPNHKYTNDTQETLLNTFHFTPKNPRGYPYTGGMKLNNDTQELNIDGDGEHDFIGSITPIDHSFFTNHHTYRLEWYPDDSINWYVDNVFLFSVNNYTIRQYVSPTWTTGQRLIPEEPMYLIFNLAISPIWGLPEEGLPWPGKMYTDWVRVYQPKGQTRVGCDPADHPTAQYIQDHQEWYYN